MIQTVNGLIEKEQLGITLSHEHLALDLRPIRKDGISYISDVEEVLAELEPLKSYGVNSIIEMTCIGMGRNVELLKEISRRTDLNVICPTGFYLKEYHSLWLEEATIDEVAELFEKEIIEGIDGTKIKAGFIGEIATSYKKIYNTEEKVFLAAAKTSKKTGCTINTHTDMGTLGVEQSKILLCNGVNPDRIIIGHCDLNLDLDYLVSILELGVNIAFDTISKTKYQTDEDRADYLLKLIDLGFEDHILLSQDVSRRTYFTKEGGKGYLAVMGYFIDLLKDRRISRDIIDKMLIYNPARMFDWKHNGKN